MVQVFTSWVYCSEPKEDVLGEWGGFLQMRKDEALAWLHNGEAREMVFVDNRTKRRVAGKAFPTSISPSAESQNEDSEAMVMVEFRGSGKPQWSDL